LRQGVDFMPLTPWASMYWVFAFIVLHLPV
jgi:hypothetical protein